MNDNVLLFCNYLMESELISYLSVDIWRHSANDSFDTDTELSNLAMDEKWHVKENIALLL